MNNVVVSKDFCSRNHVDRVYLSPVDGTYHLEDSDTLRLTNNKHPQSKQVSKTKRDKRDRTKDGAELNKKYKPGSGGTVWGTDMTVAHCRTATGACTKKYNPTVPVSDRDAWREVNKEQNKRHYTAMKLLKDPDLRRKRIHKLEVRPGVWAVDVVCYLDVKSGVWVAFCCEGFTGAGVVK